MIFNKSFLLLNQGDFEENRECQLKRGEKVNLETIKTIADLVQKAGRVDLYEQILNLREEMVELREENLALKAKLEKFQNAAEMKLVYFGNAYYKPEDGGKKQPFCTTCWDAKRELITMRKEQRKDGIVNWCKICKC